MQQKLFLRTSKRVAQRLTDIFDFVWPTAVAIWNLRWQVSGFLEVSPQTTDAELSGRFVAGSGIRGANLRRACIDSSWANQQQEFARFLLIEFCALYEAWCEGHQMSLINPRVSRKTCSSPLRQHMAVSQGVGRAINIVKATVSTEMAAAIYPAISKNTKNSKPYLEQLLVCYRYFKEARNCLVHGGGTTSPSLQLAEASYQQLTLLSLGVKEKPEHCQCDPTDGVKPSLRGVVGFGRSCFGLYVRSTQNFVRPRLRRLFSLSCGKKSMELLQCSFQQKVLQKRTESRDSCERWGFLPRQ